MEVRDGTSLIKNRTEKNLYKFCIYGTELVKNRTELQTI